MAWRDIKLLYLHEIRCAFRERNVLLYVVLVPALLYPLLVWLTMTTLSFILGQSEKTPAAIVIHALPPRHADLAALMRKDIKASQVEVRADLPPTPALPGNSDVCLRFDENGNCKVYYDSSRQRSSAAKERVEAFLRRYRDHSLEVLGQQKGLTLSEMQIFGIEFKNLASGQDMGRFLLGVLLPFTLIVILSLGGMYSAIDCTAGERERGTWETSLMLATPRTHLIVAKYLYVSTMSSLAGLLNLVAMTFSLRSFLQPVAGDWANQVTMSLPLRALPVIALGTVALSALLSAVMMLLSSLARTFREGQGLVSPLFLLMLVPTTLVMDKSLEFDRSTALIPVVNVALLWRESLQSPAPWDLTLMTLLVCILGVGFCLFLAQLLLTQEGLVLEGGARLWRKLVPLRPRRQGGD